MVGTRSDVKAFNVNQGASAALIGPARSRIRQIVIFADAAGAITITNGNGGIYSDCTKVSYWITHS